MGLIRNLTEDIKRLLRQEVELAKAEVSEKLSAFGRNAVSVAMGGFIAYAGMIVLLMGLGWLVAWVLQKAGLPPVLAGFIGLAGVGVLVAAVGAVLLITGLKAFSKDSLTPRRTIHTIQRLKLPEPQIESKTESAPKRSSQEVQAQVLATEDRMTGAMSELGQRLTPRHINAQLKHRIEQKPYRSGLLAMAAGILSGWFLTRAARRS
jgi:hypothetical protein